MKRISIILIAFTCVLHCKAQSVNGKDTLSKKGSIGEPSIDAQTIYTSVDLIPSFPGGMPAFNQFIKKNLKWPIGEEDVRGKVLLQFVVERDGSLTDIKILRSPTLAFGREAVRLIKQSPKWAPAKINGIPVRCYYTMPVDFQILRED